MDSLKTILEKGNYNLVLDLTKDSSDADSLFARLEALYNLRKFDDALALIVKYRKVLLTRMISLMEIHFDILFVLNRYEEAYKELDYYQNLPYVSMEVEELFAKIKSDIRKREREFLSHKDLSLSEIRNGLHSDNQYEVLLSLNEIKDIGAAIFYEDIVKVVTSSYNENVRTYALLLLVNDKYNREIVFQKYGEEFKVNPKDLLPPFTGGEFAKFIKDLSASCNNPTQVEIATNLSNQYALMEYPRLIDYSNPYLIPSFLLIAKHYLNEFIDSKFLANHYNLDVQKLDDFVEVIQNRLNQYKDF